MGRETLDEMKASRRISPSWILAMGLSFFFLCFYMYTLGSFTVTRVVSPEPAKHTKVTGAPENKEIETSITLTTSCVSSVLPGPTEDSVSVKPPVTSIRESRLHYLIPTTIAKPAVCANIAAALANGYPMPTLVGYKGHGEYDAHKLHIAKLRAIQRYLESDAGDKEDDLVLVVDGFDVLAQVPAEVMIERYFDMIAEADQRTARSYNLTIPELHEAGIRNTVLWGTDKGCFPPLMNEYRCWGIPDPLGQEGIWGPRTGNGDLAYLPSKWLNSGTVMAPVGDLRCVITAALDLIENHTDSEDAWMGSDQYHLARLYARQEYFRDLDSTGRKKLPKEVVQGRLVPRPRKGENDTTEYHMLADFDMRFTQTQCQNEEFLHRIKYDGTDHHANVTHDWLHYESYFSPYQVAMPSNMYAALKRVHENARIVETFNITADEWINSLPLWTNVGTEVIFGFYHNTCDKKEFLKKHGNSWYFPYIQSMIRANVRSNARGERIHPELVDDRAWLPYCQLSDDDVAVDEFGGAFTDHEEEEFIYFQDLCKERMSDTVGVLQPKGSLV